MNRLKFRTLVLFIILLLNSQFSLAQKTRLSEHSRVSIITCGLGNETYSYFGHTAIRIKDSINYIDRVYNYGAFNFDTPNFVMKFAKGDLQYFAIMHSYNDFIKVYVSEKRSIYEQELIINQHFKQEIFNNLNTTLLPENRYYTYKFIDKNCTSMVVDIINKSLDQNVIFKESEKDKTYRTILFPYFDGHFYEKLVTSIIFGTKVDQFGTKIFLPFELKKTLEKTVFQNHLLAKKSETLVTYEKETPVSWWNNPYTYVAMLILIILINKKSIDQGYLIFLSLMGIFFVCVGFYSFHEELAMNYNTLLFSPLLLIMIIFSGLNNKKRTYQLAIFHLILLIAYTLYMINKVHFVIVLPMILTSGVVLVRVIIRNKKRIPIII